MMVTVKRKKKQEEMMMMMMMISSSVRHIKIVILEPVLYFLALTMQDIVKG
jgi:hypothetical protein